MEIKEIFRDPLSAFGFIILCFGAIMCIVVPLYALFNEIKNKKIPKMRKKIMFIYRSQPSDFEQIKQVSIKIASCGNYETSVISENYAEIIFKSLKPDITICLAECGDNDPSWDNIRKVFGQIRKLIQPNQKLIRIGISSLQEGCKDIYYRLPIDAEQWKFILS